MKANERNSSIELLKVVAVAIIVLSHAAAGGLTYVNGISANVLTAEMVNLGQIGNCLFFIASAWFLCTSAKVKHDKAVKLVVESIATSLTCMLLVPMLGYKLTKGEIILSAMPIIYGYNWFISCYLLVYMIHPLLNTVISSIKREYHFSLIAVLVAIYGVFNLALGGVNCTIPNCWVS